MYDVETGVGYVFWSVIIEVMYFKTSARKEATYKSQNHNQKGFTLLELLISIAIIGILASIVMYATSQSRIRSRDATRISQIRQIKYALEQYYLANGRFPSCLYTGGSCGASTLQGSIYMPNIPKDPLTGVNYTYAGRRTGSDGTNCTSYHLGVSLEDKSNTVMRTGADAPAVGTLCTGSASDFSGLSYAAGGQMCNGVAGVAQPSSAATAESCYDLVP